MKTEDVMALPAVEQEKPRFIHAWVCTADECPGRKPGNVEGKDGNPPKCECGADMVRHWWSIKTKRSAGAVVEKQETAA